MAQPLRVADLQAAPLNFTDTGAVCDYCGQPTTCNVCREGVEGVASMFKLEALDREEILALNLPTNSLTPTLEPEL